MVTAGSLQLSNEISRGFVQLDTAAQHIAIRSESSEALPFIKWTILEVVKGKIATSDASAIYVNPSEFGLKYLRPGTPIIWRPISPVSITKVVLTASPETFQDLQNTKDRIRTSLPNIVQAGRFLPGLGCHIRACEPVDEGLLPADRSNLSISVIELVQKEHMNGHAKSDIDVQPFLVPERVHSLKLKVKTLARPMPVSSILPAVPDCIDTESLGFVTLPQLAKLGIFSGDLVTLTSLATGKTRRIHVYSFPIGHEAAVEDAIFLPPLLAFNLGAASTVEVSPVSTEGAAGQSFEAARDVTLSRVSSPNSTDKANQAAFLRGLRSYFAQGRVRVVKNEDLIPVPINSSLAKLLGNGSSGNGGSSSGGGNGGTSNNSDEDEPDLQSLYDEATSVDTMIWFQIDGLPTENEYLISASHTRMVQSGLVQRLAPPTSIHWQSYYGLPQQFPYLSYPHMFTYAQKLEKLLRASMTLRGSQLKTTILLKSSKMGAGKSTLLHSVAESLGIHEMSLNALDLIKETDGKTLGLLKARLERASSSSPCLVTIKHFDTLAKKADTDGKDTPLVNGLVDVLDDLLGASDGLILAATVRDPDTMADSVRNKFKFEIDVTVPSEPERRAIFEYLTSDNGGFSHMGQLLPHLSRDVFTRFALRGDVSIESLALQSAGLTPPDLCAIIRTAKQIALERSTDVTVISCGGVVKLSPADLEEAIRDARDKFSDSIGAPKIPNVGWKDVGGLDMVKGEILDTIDMPLKHPELFSSGLKKRSGILFYGPPGTGKTLLAKAIATNFSLNFFSVKGPELLNMYIGESEANVRRVFQKARDAKPCVVFFDELDSVAPKRGNKGDSGGVMDRIVSQLLAELDGMSEGSDGVFVVGATNRPDLLDEALLRPGRFDKMLYLGISDTHEKQKKILEALTRKFDLDPKVDLGAVAANCPFTYTGADFYAMSSDAMLNAMTRTAGEVDAKIKEYNEKHPEAQVTIRRWFQSIATPEDVKVRVSDVDFQKAQRELVPSVSADELEHYLRVRNTFEGNT